MNRGIKYKGWVDLGDGDTCMIDVEMIDFEKSLVRGRTSNSEVHAYLEFVKLLQYTGINDKNGVEIYEGYILDIKSPIMGYEQSDVKHANGSFRFGGGPSLLGGYLSHEIEVIGNIYETPELQEVK